MTLPANYTDPKKPDKKGNTIHIIRNLPQASSSKKRYQVAQLPEAVSKSDKLTGRLKMLYNLPKDSDKYFKQQNPPEVDRLKKAQGNALTPQVAQIVPTSKNNQVPFKYSTYGIDTTNREEGLKKKVRRMERLGILHGGTRAKDLQ